MSDHSPEEIQEMLDTDKKEAAVFGIIGGAGGGAVGVDIVLKTHKIMVDTSPKPEHLSEVESASVVGGLAIAGAVVAGSLFYMGRRQLRKWLGQV